MSHTMTTAAILAAIMGLTFCPVFAQDSADFDLSGLAGEWNGGGEVLIPHIALPVSIEGRANFAFDSLTQRLRTSLEAHKFLFGYADSGYLFFDPATDSITWEVWDGFGKHCLYTGIKEGNVITGTQKIDEDTYYIVIDMITDDSLSFKLMTTNEKGRTRQRAAIDLRRTK
jgi:hypothetical protein